MPSFDTFSNPFDHRAPITEARDLAARQHELRWFGRALSYLEQAKPRHGLLIGPSGFGKTSLLNAYETVAAQRDFLPVRFALNDSVVASAEGFFEALLSAGMSSLERVQALRPDDTRLRQWKEQVGRSQGDVLPLLLSPCQPFVDPTTVHRDLEVLSTLARESGRKGLAILIDDAQMIRDDEITIGTIRALQDLVSDCVFVFACTPDWFLTLRESYRDLLRRLEWVVLRPILSYFEISDILVGRIQPELDDRVDLQYPEVFDIAIATRGHPRLLQMVASHMWERARSLDFHDYRCTPEILEGVLVERQTVHAEDNMPEFLTEAADLVDELSRLSHADLEDFRRVAPLEALTMRESALAVLAQDEVERDVEERADTETELLNSIVERFVSAGVVEWTGEDRFKIRGGAFGHGYLRRVIAEKTKKKVEPPARSYGEPVSASFFERMCKSCAIHEKSEDVINRFRVTSQPSSADRPIAKLAEAMQHGEVSALEDSEIVSLYFATFPPDANRDQILLAGVELTTSVDSTLALELERVDIGGLFWLARDADISTLQEKIEAWFAERTELLAAYRLTFDRAIVALADPTLADKLVAVAAPQSVSRRSIAYFESGDLDAGSAYLLRAAEAFDATLARDPSPVAEARTSDAYQRAGFFAALRGKADEMDRALRRTSQLQSPHYLDTYNAAYLRALRGEYAAAADLAREAVPNDNAAYLLLFLPAPSGFNPPFPRWNAALVEERIREVIETQAVAYDALAGRFNRDEFAERIGDFGDDLSPPQHRVIGWTLYSKFGDAASAAHHFEHAAAQKDAAAPSELQFVEKG